MTRGSGRESDGVRSCGGRESPQTNNFGELRRQPAKISLADEKERNNVALMSILEPPSTKALSDGDGGQVMRILINLHKHYQPTAMALNVRP